MNEQELSDVRSRMLDRIRVSAQIPTLRYPHFSDEQGAWKRTDDGDWTGGFFVGELWLAAHCMGLDPEVPRRWAAPLRRRVTSRTIFRGFLFYYGCSLANVLCNDAPSGQLALHAAEALANDVANGVGVIGLGDEAEEATNVGVAETSIDAVGAICGLLGWATRYTGDRRFSDLATSHLRWHLTNLVRDDGSVVQSATFDPGTGGLVRTYTHKGLGANSTWARAQAWGLLACVQGMTWIPTERDFTISHARAIADWWLDHNQGTWIPQWDFDAPKNESEPLDTSAAAITASSLLKLAAHETDSERSVRYYNGAVNTVFELVKHVTPVSRRDSRPHGMLVDGCFNRPLELGLSSELIWGDYFLFESLNVLLREIGALDV